MEALEDQLEESGSLTPSETALSLLKKIVLKHKDYGFMPGNYAKRQLAELVDAELLINHGSHYSVSALGIEVFATL